MIVQLVVATGNRAGQIVPVATEKFIIGRAEDCHLKARSELVSRYHCAIIVGDDVVVRDLGSKNGVRLNGEKVSTEQKTKNGDQLVIGPLEFYVHIAADSESVGLLEDGYPDTHISWIDRSSISDRPTDSSAMALLDHLKSLNQEAKTEPEQPVLDLLKKFL